MFRAYRAAMETHTRASGTAAGPLGLGSVLVGSLPTTLMTAGAPRRYTVEAVFTRRPEPDEVAGILGSGTRDALTRAGYAGVELTVSDRRLEIGGTNLEELRDGLARVLADRLAEITAEVRTHQEAAAAEFRKTAESEHDRAAAVAALAQEVSFRTSPDHAASAPSSNGSLGERDESARINVWTDEGGHGR